MNDEPSNETRTRATDDAKYPERTADGRPARRIDNVSHSDGDPFAAPRYFVRSRRHQGNSRRDHNED